jgi:hypothetical protein
LGCSRERADRWNEAATFDHLGDTCHSLGDTAAARGAWTQALRIFGEIDHPDGDPLRAKLHSHPQPATRQPSPASTAAGYQPTAITRNCGSVTEMSEDCPA